MPAFTLPPRAAVVPGARHASIVKLRLVEIGRFSTSCVGTVKDRSPLVVCTSGASPVTVIVSFSAPTSRVSDAKTQTIAARDRKTPAVDCLEPLQHDLACGRCREPGSPREIRRSTSVTTAGTAVPLLSLVNVIVTPGSTPPCASFTLPVIVAVVSSCADDVRGPKTISAMANPAIQRDVICLLCWDSCRSQFHRNELLLPCPVREAHQFVFGPRPCSRRGRRADGLDRIRGDR